jgi:hypothetical protein
MMALIFWPGVTIRLEQLRWLLTEERSLNYHPAWIDDEVAAETARYCNEPLIDQTGGEDVWFSTTTGSPGTDFKRYRSTGLVDVHYWRNRLRLTFVHPAEQEIVYQLYSPATPLEPRANHLVPEALYGQLAI